jgi:hypothetical protein
MGDQLKGFNRQDRKGEWWWISLSLDLVAWSTAVATFASAALPSLASEQVIN